MAIPGVSNTKNQLSGYGQDKKYKIKNDANKLYQSKSLIYKYYFTISNLQLLWRVRHSIQFFKHINLRAHASPVAIHNSGFFHKPKRQQFVATIETYPYIYIEAEIDNIIHTNIYGAILLLIAPIHVLIRNMVVVLHIDSKFVLKWNRTSRNACTHDDNPSVYFHCLLFTSLFVYK